MNATQNFFLILHAGVEQPEAIKADFQVKDEMFIIDMQVPLVGYAMRWWSVDCTPIHLLDPRSHHLYLSNLQTLYGVESALLGPGYLSMAATSQKMRG